jgi:chromosome partitioning protein
MSLAAVASEVCRVLLVDTDAQGSATWWAERAGERLPFDFATDLDPANLTGLRGLDYDVILVDTPGSLHGREVLGRSLGRPVRCCCGCAPSLLAASPDRVRARN